MQYFVGSKTPEKILAQINADPTYNLNIIKSYEASYYELTSNKNYFKQKSLIFLTLYCVKILKQDYTSHKIASIYNDLINFINTIFSDKTDEEKHKLLVAFVLSFNPSEGNNINNQDLYPKLFFLIPANNYLKNLFNRQINEETHPDDLDNTLFNFKYNKTHDLEFLLSKWSDIEEFNIKYTDNPLRGTITNRQGGKRVSRRRRRNRTKRRRRRHVSRRT
jgi:hypothetical protein